MDFDIVARRLDGIPHTNARRGRVLYDFVIEHELRNVLELGFAHGVSTCYLAAAVDELGGGRVVTMDREKARNREPNLETLSTELGLRHLIEPVYSRSSFTWDLREWLRRGDRETFDFIFNDGGHSWDVAGYTFFLTDALLKAGGWMLFDDLTWTIGTSRSPAMRDRAKKIPQDQRDTPQVGEVFELLVTPHPGYTDVHTTEKGNWGWARKRSRLATAAHVALHSGAGARS